MYLIVPYYLDNRGNYRANACINTQPNGLLGGDLVIHNNSANRMAPCRRWIIQVSFLSDLDGRLLLFHVFNG